MEKLENINKSRVFDISRLEKSLENSKELHKIEI